MALSQVSSQQQLINLLDLAVYVRNVSFFVLTLLYLRRASIKLEFIEREEKVVKISGPWRAAILYALEKQQNEHYDAIFNGQFFDLNQHQALPLPAFVDALCDNFTRYQRFADGQYAIVPTPKQKAFLQARLAALRPPPSAGPLPPRRPEPSQRAATASPFAPASPPRPPRPRLRAAHHHRRGGLPLLGGGVGQDQGHPAAAVPDVSLEQRRGARAPRAGR